MEFVPISEPDELLPLLPVEDEPKGFAKYMEETGEEEDETEPLMDGPVTAPLILPIPTWTVTIARIPKELQPLIVQLPTQIQTSFDKGLEQTKFVIAISPHEEVEVVIDKYDTNPTTFHVSFYGSEQTALLIAQKQPLLIAALQAALPRFAFAISPPFRSFPLSKRGRLGYSPVKPTKKSS